jgi:hypothetical protein
MAGSLPKNAQFNVSPEMIAGVIKCPEWDVMMLGDGSGTGGWTMAGGWACVTVERESDNRSICWGGWSTCDILLAELSAYFQALVEFENTRGEVLRKHLGRPVKILVITDNQPIASQAPAALVGGKVGGNTNALWAAIRHITQSSGISIQFRFVPRCAVMLNVLADQVCGRVRKLLGDPTLGEYRVRGVNSSRTLESLNPKNL